MPRTSRPARPGRAALAIGAGLDGPAVTPRTAIAPGAAVAPRSTVRPRPTVAPRWPAAAWRRSRPGRLGRFGPWPSAVRAAVDPHTATVGHHRHPQVRPPERQRTAHVPPWV